MTIEDEPQWIESEDDDGNTVWSADSPYCEIDDGDGFLLWRLKQRVRFNRHEWYEDHDPGLMDYNDDYSWPTIEEAKAAIAKAHRGILEDIANNCE